MANHWIQGGTPLPRYSAYCPVPLQIYNLFSEQMSKFAMQTILNHLMHNPELLRLNQCDR